MKGGDKMEYSTHHDYYISFDQVLDPRENHIHYQLKYVSDNFSRFSQVNTNKILGKYMFELIDNLESDFFFLKDIYNHLGPNTIRKFEKYDEESDRWYLINIFSENKALMILYTDITVMKKYLVNRQDLINKNTSEICYKDGLTGVYSKDYFKVELSRLDTDKNLPLSIIIGDLNGLKLINDAFGYHIGDEAIKSTSDILKRSFRKEDIISRLGGDEFVILLPNTSKKDAKARVEELENQFDLLRFDFIDLSMSFGAATKDKLNQNLMDVYKSAEDKMYFNKLQESKETKMKILKNLKKRLMSTTNETFDHHERLKGLAYILGTKMGIEPGKQEELRLLCEYHDIGTISLPNHLFYKEERLSEEDWYTIKRHCEIGYHIMKSVSYDNPIADHVLMHHERWDGNGYPRLLKGEEIPLIVRIFTIIDAYEAMVNNRSYGSRLSHEEALEEIMANSGRQFDPYIVEVFIAIMTKGENIKYLY